MDYQQTKQKIKELRKAGELNKALQLTVALKGDYQKNDKLHKLINSLKTEIRRAEIKNREKFIKKGLKTVRELRREDKFEQAIQAGAELLEVDPNNSKAQKLLQKSKVDFIEQKLHDPIRKEWQKKEEFEKLYLFYQKLKKVFPHYIKLNKLIIQTEQKMIAVDRKQKKTFADESLKKLQQMLAEGKYEAVIDGAEELVTFTHEGSTGAKKILKIAEKANLREIEDDTYKYMQDQQPLLKSAYKSGEGGMIKL
jgi:hypothetical protein